MRCIGLSIVLLVPLILSAGAVESDTGCDKFAWPLVRERALFASAKKITIDTGAKLAAIPARAMLVKLQSGDKVSFALPPERKSRSEHWFGGVISFGSVSRMGIYQVTLSEDAWIDIVQDNQFVRSVGSSGRRDCAGVRKTIRLELGAAPFVMQISGVESETVLVVIRPRE